MKTSEIVAKLWKLCDVLRDDGITYQDYVTELTYILFLKMANETNTEDKIPKQYRWENLKSKDGLELQHFYNELLEELGTETGIVGMIFKGASSSIREPKNLKKIIEDIDKLDWYEARKEGLGDLYEGLLEKNATEKKSGAGQYFTPRVLIDVMTELTKPQIGERCNDPACGTFGFMIAVDHYLREHTDNFKKDFVTGKNITSEQYDFQKQKACSGCELVPETRRLALMNAMLHDLEGNILLGDTLSDLGKSMKDFDVVLTNPPFGTKRGGERASRTDLTYATSNKQLNFLQHIYRSLKANGKARAAVVLPDNVLFDAGDGAKIRCDLMDKCNLHTVLRLPTGIFYANGVKTNVLFFTRGTEDQGNTKEVWFYDLRSKMKSFGKKNPLKHEDFDEFIKAYTAEDRHSIQDERWTVFTREQIKEKGDTLDLGLIQEEVQEVSLEELITDSEECLSEFKETMNELQKLVEMLKEIEPND